jgi:hypothetical protein
MGSASSPVFSRAKVGIALLGEVDRLARESVTRTGQIDLRAIQDVLDQALHARADRADLLMYLGAYLVQCLNGSIPDKDLWNPFE